jgi:hypothetical protein
MSNMHITIQATSPDLIEPGTNGKTEFDADGIIIIALDNVAGEGNEIMQQPGHGIECGDIHPEMAVATLLGCESIGRLVFDVVARMVLNHLNTPENLANLSEPAMKALQEVIAKQQEQDAREQAAK